MPFSEATKTWLHHQADLRAAEKQFRFELARMFGEVLEHFQARGWQANVGGDPTTIVQLYRPGWPSGWGGLHYEIDAPEDLVRQGHAQLGLHVEDEVPRQPNVLAALTRLLQTHGERLSDFPCRMRDGDERILDGALDLLKLTGRDACDALQTLMKTESLVDEALFLAGKKVVCRTDLLPNQAVPKIDWPKGGGNAPRGGTGGWELRDGGGRLDSPSLICRGDPGNFNYKDGQDIVTLFEQSYEFRNGQRMYASAVVLAPEGGTFTFYSEAPREGKWRVAFQKKIQLVPSNRWQVVTFEGEVSDPEDCDFATHGLHLHLMVVAPRSGLTIDAVEIGSREPPRKRTKRAATNDTT